MCRKFFDLSRAFEQGMSYSLAAGHPEISIRPFKSPGGFNVTELHITTHAGTNVDAPYHQFDDGKTMEQFPLEQFYGPGVIVDLPKGDLQIITEQDFENASPKIRHKDILIVRTGWESKWTVEEYKWKYPYLDESAARWLVSNQIKMIGVDAQSIDPSIKSGLRKAGAIIHRIVLGAGILICENLTNLSTLTGNRVFVFAFPIRVKPGDGGPARVVATEDNDGTVAEMFA